LSLAKIIAGLFAMAAAAKQGIRPAYFPKSRGASSPRNSPRSAGMKPAPNSLAAGLEICHSE